jgi:RNA polymerase sigma factor (sigma-70 family)
MEQVSKKSLGQLLHHNRVRKINRMYAGYRLDPTEENLNTLLQGVIDLSSKKLRADVQRVGDVDMENNEDFAQKVVITVWEKLKEFDKETEAFYPWVMTIIKNYRLWLYKNLRDSVVSHVPLTVQDEEGNEYDNPDVYSSAGSGGWLMVPEGLSEEEELIVYMLLDKHTHSEIAEFLEVHVNTVGNKIKSLKERFAEVQVA